MAREEFHPLLICGATGAALRRFAESHPRHRLVVLAGHTHAARETAIAPNLHCVVGGARYGAPTVMSFTP